jgi:hypothetical protein
VSKLKHYWEKIMAERVKNFAESMFELKEALWRVRVEWTRLVITNLEIKFLKKKLKLLDILKEGDLKHYRIRSDD